MRRGIEQRGLGIDGGARADVTMGDVAGGERNQVGRDGVLHVKDAIACDGAHHGAQRGGGGDARRKRHAHARTILQRDPASGVDRLRLREERLSALLGIARGDGGLGITHFSGRYVRG